jgi:very-long-chain ceramide synthase
MGFHIAALFN